MVRYEEAVGLGGVFLEEVLQRICDGKRLDEVCKDMDLPYGRIYLWLGEDNGRWERYRKALEVYWDLKAMKTMEVAEAGPPDGEDVNRDNLRVKTALRIAEAKSEEWRRTRKVDVSVKVDLGERLRRAQMRLVGEGKA